MGVMTAGTSEYVTLHKRITRTRGRADLQHCIDCNKRARDWSLAHGGYQLNYEDYEPRCRSCHKKHDITDETRQRMSRGLIGVRNGAATNSNIITEEQVLEIRSLYTTGNYSQNSLGIQFGVSQTCISKIIRRVNWHHV